MAVLVVIALRLVDPVSVFVPSSPTARARCGWPQACPNSCTLENLPLHCKTSIRINWTSFKNIVPNDGANAIPSRLSDLVELEEELSICQCPLRILRSLVIVQINGIIASHWGFFRGLYFSLTCNYLIETAQSVTLSVNQFWDYNQCLNLLYDNIHWDWLLISGFNSKLFCSLHDFRLYYNAWSDIDVRASTP